MERSLHLRKNNLDAFIELAENLANFTIQQNIWDRIGKSIVDYFDADMTAFSEQGAGGEIITNHWNFSDSASQDLAFSTKAERIASGVLKNGSPEPRLILINVPYATAFLPIKQDARITNEMFSSRFLQPRRKAGAQVWDWQPHMA